MSLGKERKTIKEIIRGEDLLHKVQPDLLDPYRRKFLWGNLFLRLKNGLNPNNSENFREANLAEVPTLFVRAVYSTSESIKKEIALKKKLKEISKKK